MLLTAIQKGPGKRFDNSRFRLAALSLILLFALLPALSCKKVINVDLNDAAPKIVIEGEVTDQVGPFTVKVTQTVPFSASNEFPGVTGAVVTITDSANALVYPLAEKSPGNYSTSTLRGFPGHTYLLSVAVGGKTYTASSKMPFAVKLDSVGFAENRDINNNKEINAVVNFQDPTGLGNDYRFVEHVGTRLVPDIFVFEDRLSDGRYIQQALYNDSAYLQKGDTLTVDMYCIDPAIYHYFFALLQVAGDNNFQTATPANPDTNISGGALGYFSAHTVRTEKIAIE
jgi:hypothetical protein